MQVNEDSNWVRARAACSVAKVFDELRSAVQADVDERNALREGEAAKFSVHSPRNGFTVVREGTAINSTIEFTHDGSAILVEGKGLSLRAFLGLNLEGVCRFHVDGVELEGWQFRMKALDALFFEEGR